jgi:tape measure domain-containing protein
MAVTVERLIATLEARIDKYEKNLQKAYGQTDRQFSRIERRGKMMESRLSKIGAGGFLKNFGAGFVGGIASAFSVKAAQDLIDSATRIQNALKVAGLSGADLTKVYDRLFESAQKNAAPLEALATLYGRAAQQQKELGVSTDQLLQFTDNVSVALRVAGTDAGTASGALLQLGQALGSGTVHAEEFNSILEGVPTIAQAAAVGIKEANGSVAALKQLVVDGKVSSRAFFDGFAAGADTLAAKAANASMTTSQGFTVLTNSLIRAAERFDTSTEASKRFGDALHTLSLYVDQLNFDSMLAGLDAVAGRLNSMIVTIQNWGAAFGQATGSENFGRWLASTRVGQALGVQSTAALRDRMSGDVPQADAVIQAWAQKTYGSNFSTQKTDRLPEAQSTAPISLADYPVTGGKGKKGSRGGGGGVKKTADDRFAEDVQNIKDRTEALRMEREALGLSYQEQEKRKVQFDLEKQALHDVQEAARRKGDTDWQNVQLSQEQKAAIDSVSSAYADQAEQLRQAQEAQELNADVLRTAFDGVRSALEDGKITMQEWGQIGLSVLDKLIDKIEDDLIEALSKAGSGGGGGGLIGALFSGIGSLFGFASGTANTGGRRGEPRGVVHGQEAVIPLPSGGKVPVQIDSGVLASARDIPGFENPANSQQSVHVTVGVSADNNGNLMPFVESVSERKAGQVSTAAIGRYDKGLPSRIAETMERHG